MFEILYEVQKVSLCLVFKALLFLLPGNELRPDSFSGGMDLYGEQRHSYRSRSDMESPRSPVNFLHKYIFRLLLAIRTL